VIEPETKDWTWVLQRPCPDCGLDPTSFPREDVVRLLRENTAKWAPVLTRPDVRERPSPDKWSPLEYACHVRDVHRKFRERLALMLTEDDPLFPNWDQDATAVEERYGSQDPAVVSGELTAAASALADAFAAVSGAEWDRPGRRSDGKSFTVETLARYFLHDPVHHLWDVS
jgi:hypothetical protein